MRGQHPVVGYTYQLNFKNEEPQVSIVVTYDVDGKKSGQSCFYSIAMMQLFVNLVNQPNAKVSFTYGADQPTVFVEVGTTIYDLPAEAAK